MAKTKKKGAKKQAPLPKPVVNKGEPLRGGITPTPLPQPKKGKKKLPGLQEVADGLFWHHGKNCRSWPDFKERVQALGLPPETEFPDSVWLEAEKHLTQRIEKAKEIPPPTPLEWTGPVKEDFEGISTFDVWETKDKAYRVARVSGADPRFVATAKIDGPHNGERIIANDLKTLERAFEKIEDHHQKIERRGINGNGLHVIAEARINGIHVRERATDYRTDSQKAADEARLEKLSKKGKSTLENDADWVTITVTESALDSSNSEKGETSVKVLEKNVKRILKSLGHEDLAKAKKTELTEKLNDGKFLASLLEAAEASNGALNDKDKVRVRKIAEAVADGGKVVLDNGSEKGEKSPKVKKETSGPSNKEQVYKLWKKTTPDKADADKAFAAVKEAVKLTTIRSWMAAWKNGKNLPACAGKND